MSSEQLTEIKQLLQTCGLPSEDLTVAHLAHFFAERKNSVVIACVGLEIFEKSGLLRSLAVAEGWRGRGLGRKLVHTIEQYAVWKNIQSLYLLTESAADFFAQIGYMTIARNEVQGGVRDSAEFQTLCPDSAICMIKRLH